MSFNSPVSITHTERRCVPYGSLLPLNCAAVQTSGVEATSASPRDAPL